MAAYDTLRAAIDSYIKANGNKEITGTVLNDILNAMVSALGADTRFAGVAVPSTNPGNPEGNVVYFASQAGTYSNFGGIVLPLGIHILVWNGTAWTSQTWFSIDNTPTQNSQNLATSGGILQAIVDAVGVERLRAIGAEVTSCSFDRNTKKISFFNSANTTLFQLDATAFVIDGMVSDVKIEDGNLVVQFNTDAGKQDIEIPLTDIFNPANYYTKTAIDALLASYYTKTETDALLTAINNKLADGCLYRGMAEPTTNPPTPTTKVFYIATKAGTYTNFGNIAVTEGITILKHDGSNWSKEQICYSDGVFDISAYNGTSYADLSAALGTNGANIPQNLRKGGMSVKFVQSSDNNYVQYRLMAQSFTTDVTQWEGSINDAAGIGVFNKTNSADKITNIKQQSAQYGALSGEGYLFIMPEYTFGNLDKDTGEINPDSNRKTTQFIDAATEDVTINVSGGIRICVYDLTNHQFESYTDKNVSSYVLEKGKAYRISLDTSNTIYLQYPSNLKKIVSKVNPISEYLDVLSDKSSKGIVSIYPDFVDGNLNKDTGEIVSVGNRKTTKLFYSPYNLSLVFNGTIRICQYDLNGVFISYSDNTYNHDVILQTGYAYRISTDSEYDLLIYFNRNISELVTKNLSPSNRANVIAGGYINASSGNNGNFGSVEANKTYVFSCVANVKSANCSNIQIRLNYSGTYKAIGFINTSTITKNKDVYCFVTIKPDVDGYLTLTGSSFISDVGTVLFDCQVEEGSTPTGYVPYNNQSAIDYISRSQIADWKKGKYLPYASGVKSVAHQGYREFGANANTLQAYIDAKKAGFDMVETDVIMTLDRVPVISHDDVRTTVDNVSVTISNTNYSDLAEMQFYSDPSIKIPTLWEAFNTCNIHNIGVMLELKGADFTQQEINEILNYAKGLGIYVMYVSFISSTLITVRSIDENASVSFTLTQVPTIQELQTDSDYQYLRNALAQRGKTSICGDFTSEDWILQAKKLGYSIILDYANHIVNKTLIPYAFACLSNEYTVNELT